jgi:hypothetical protein
MAGWKIKVSSVVHLARTQCEIIQGRLVGKLFEPSFPRLVKRENFLLPPEQQLHPLPCRSACSALNSADVRGACAFFSFAAWATRRSEDRPEKCGAVRMTLCAELPQSGQSCGRSYSAIGRMSVKGPQLAQR